MRPIRSLILFSAILTVISVPFNGFFLSKSISTSDTSFAFSYLLDEEGSEPFDLEDLNLPRASINLAQTVPISIASLRAVQSAFQLFHSNSHAIRAPPLYYFI